MIHNHLRYTTDTVEFIHAFSEFPMHIIILKYKEVNCMSVLWYCGFFLLLLGWYSIYVYANLPRFPFRLHYRFNFKVSLELIPSQHKMETAYSDIYLSEMAFWTRNMQEDGTWCGLLGIDWMVVVC